MLSTIKRFVVFLCAMAIILLPLATASFAASEESKDNFSAEKMAVDLIAIRPLGIVSTVAGCAVYILSLPFSLPGGNAAAVWETTVEKPAKYTFDRPLGDF
jgi:hypothetical protein